MLVVKFSRVGQKVPIETKVIRDLLSCEFNGPFEEFALVEELRHSRRGPDGLMVRTQVPLAIYVPPDEWQPSQTGRFQWRIANRVAKHPGIAIDILRDYIMVYGWMPGIDICQAEEMGWLTHEEMLALNQRAIDEAAIKGFQVLDMKPVHVIVQAADRDQLVQRRRSRRVRDGRFRAPREDPGIRAGDHERPPPVVPAAAPRDEAGRHRAAARRPNRFPTTCGRRGSSASTTSTVTARAPAACCGSSGATPISSTTTCRNGGAPRHQIRLFENHETYLTTSKDAVRLVWKVSRVGEYPEVAAYGPDGFQLLAQGFNSPFEEIGLAYWLRRNGVRTILPRAIYRTGHKSQLKESLFDPSRYQSHQDLESPDGEPILETGRNYVTLWDQWDGPVHLDDETEATVYRSINAAEAVERELLTDEEACRARGVGRRTSGRAGRRGSEATAGTPPDVDRSRS